MEKTEDEIIQKLNKDHAAVMLGGKFAILTETINPATEYPEIQFSTVADIKNLYRNQKISKIVEEKAKLMNPADVWLDHKDRRQYRGIVFTPNQPPNGYFNLWKGFAVQPKQGDCSLYLELMQDIICNGDEYHFQYLMDWMADSVQNPGGARPGTAVVLRGLQGTGKGVFATNFGKIFGSHFVHISGQHRLTGKFNNHLKMALMVFVDEGFWAGDRRDTGTLKAMITEEYMLVEPKFQDSFPLKNHMRVIMASNNDWVIPADLEERRFFVLDVSDKRRVDTEYFGKIVRQMDAGGRQALLYDLLNRQITSNLREIPRTQALFDQILESMDSICRWWMTCLQNEKITDFDESWPVYLLPAEVQDSYLQHCNNSKERHPITGPYFFKKLRKICPDIRLKKTDIGEGRLNYYCFPYLEECRNNFETKVKIAITWGEDYPPF
jgi:phage/plasmid-associated DNA primase